MQTTRLGNSQYHLCFSRLGTTWWGSATTSKSKKQKKGREGKEGKKGQKHWKNKVFFFFFFPLGCLSKTTTTQQQQNNNTTKQQNNNNNNNTTTTQQQHNNNTCHVTKGMKCSYVKIKGVIFSHLICRGQVDSPSTQGCRNGRFGERCFCRLP